MSLGNKPWTIAFIVVISGSRIGMVSEVGFVHNCILCMLHNLVAGQGESPRSTILTNYETCKTCILLFNLIYIAVFESESMNQAITHEPFLLQGIYSSLSGPTLLYLADNVSVSVTAISTVFTARSVGILLGGILGGVIKRVVGPGFRHLLTLGNEERVGLRTIGQR